MKVPKSEEKDYKDVHVHKVWERLLCNDGVNQFTHVLIGTETSEYIRSLEEKIKVLENGKAI